MEITKIKIPNELAPILDNLANSYLVGGCVRDHLLGLEPKDIDIEVYQTDYQQLSAFLENHGKVDLVGKAFGVIKLTLESGDIYDFSLARKDSKIEAETGHKAFSITTDPNMSVTEGCARRDLTINSMAYDPRTQELLDPYNGFIDLQNRILRHTSPQFVEDPLRVLRVMQFASRFDFVVAEETVDLCKSMQDQCNTLPKERIGEEFYKMFTKGENIKTGLHFLVESGWSKNFPEIDNLVGCQQDMEDWHPEGDAFEHTGYCCNAALRLPRWQAMNDTERYTHMLGVLCHDLGKPATTKQEFKPKLGRLAWVSPGHDKAGEEPTRNLLAKLNVPKDIIRQVVPMVTHHMDHLQITRDAHIRQLAVHMGHSSIYSLGIITEADHSGRPPLPAEQPAPMQHILKRAEALNCLYDKQKPIMQGKHIANWSKLEPGKSYGVLCNAAYEAQIKGLITDEASAQSWFKLNRGKILENAKMAPPRLVDGRKLLALFDNKPGPELGALHRDIFEKQIDGEITTEAEAFEFIITNATNYKLDPDKISSPIPDL